MRGLILALIMALFISFGHSLELAIATSKNSYSPGEEVKIAGSLTDNGEGVSRQKIGVAVLDNSNRIIFVGESVTDSNGEFLLAFNLPETSELGIYNAKAGYKNIRSEISFKVQSGQEPMEELPSNRNRTAAGSGSTDGISSTPDMEVQKPQSSESQNQGKEEESINKTESGNKTKPVEKRRDEKKEEKEISDREDKGQIGLTGFLVSKALSFALALILLALILSIIFFLKKISLTERMAGW